MFDLSNRARRGSSGEPPDDCTCAGSFKRGCGGGDDGGGGSKTRRNSEVREKACGSEPFGAARHDGFPSAGFASVDKKREKMREGKKEEERERGTVLLLIKHTAVHVNFWCRDKSVNVRLRFETVLIRRIVN